jgi:hypothetical protein
MTFEAIIRIKDLKEAPSVDTSYISEHSWAFTRHTASKKLTKDRIDRFHLL